MANIYVDSNATGAATGADWANSFLTMAAALAVDVAGDTIYVAHNHAESSAVSQSLPIAGTVAAPSRVICVNTGTGEPATTGAITTTGGFVQTWNGSAIIYGLTLNVGSGSNATTWLLAQSDGDCQEWVNCNLRLNSTSTSSTYIQFGYNTDATRELRITLRNCNLKINTTTGYVRVQFGKFRWIGGSLEAGAAFAYLFSPQVGHSDILVEGVDLSAGPTAMDLVGSGPHSAGVITFRNCKLPASWSGKLGSPTAYNLRLVMHNCDTGDTNYRLWEEDYAGSIKSETTLVRTGGASDGTTAYSWKMASSANAKYPLIPLVSPEIAVWNDTIGSSKTVTVEILHDSVINLKDDEIWLEVQHLGTSGYPLGSFANDCKANLLATAADQTDSSETWTTTGMTNPNTQKLSVTFTPQEKGYLQLRVYLAKASATVYIDPMATVV